MTESEGSVQAGVLWETRVTQTRTQVIADVCVIVLQPRVEESAQAWEAGNTAVIALPLTDV